MDWSGSFAFVFLFHALFLCVGPFWQLIIRFVQFRSRRVGQCSTPFTTSTTWMILISLSRVWYYTALPSGTKSRIVISAALSWKSVCGWGELDRSRSVFVLIKYTASEDTLRGMRCLLVMPRMLFHLCLSASNQLRRNLKPMRSERTLQTPVEILWTSRRTFTCLQQYHFLHVQTMVYNRQSMTTRSCMHEKSADEKSNVDRDLHPSCGQRWRKE